MEDRDQLSEEERGASAEAEDVEGHSFADAGEREAFTGDSDDVEGHAWKADDSKADDGV